MLGLIYGHLLTKEDRRSFAHSCKAVHDAPDVQHHITRLTLHLADITPAEAVAAVAHFPAGAVMKRLVLRAGSSAGGGQQQGNALPTLHAFDAAAGSNGRVLARLKEVQILSMKGFRIQQDGAIALGLAARHLFPNLTELELDGGEVSSQLLASLSAGVAPIKLRGLCIIESRVTDSQLLHTMGQLQHLRVLQIRDCNFLEGEHDISPLAKLRELQELHLYIYGLLPGSLSSVLGACTQLRELTVPFAHHTCVELLSTSLTTLNIIDVIMSTLFPLDVRRLPSLRPFMC